MLQRECFFVCHVGNDSLPLGAQLYHLLFSAISISLVFEEALKLFQILLVLGLLQHLLYLFDSLSDEARRMFNLSAVFLGLHSFRNAPVKMLEMLE